MRLDIKPLSVNEAWKGKRYKTLKYNQYITSVNRLLKPFDVPEGFLVFTATVGYSNKNADIDNFLKPLIDILQNKYNFNDNRIKRLVVNVEHTDKGQEFIDWQLEAIT